jgi:hypothetical protein
MKRLICILAALSFGALAAPFAQALNLPVGDWQVNANGFHGLLRITGVNIVGDILPGSSIFGNRIVGFYDRTSARINFIRIIPTTSPTGPQIYNGYLFRDIPNPRLWELTGEFSAYRGSGGVAQRIDYGWVATKVVFTPLGSEDVDGAGTEGASPSEGTN